MDNRKIERILRKNRYINARFAGHFASFTSLWNALFAPIIIGLGVSYVFQKKDITNGISDFFFIACIMFFILHLILAWGAKYLDKKDDSTIELGELTKEYNDRVSEIEIIRERMVQEDKLSTTQKLVIYLTTLQVNSHIRKILIANKEKKLTLADFPIDTESFFSTVLGYLSRNRETLFSYKSESKFNIALYIYNKERNHLEVICRICDDRITKKNRAWKPGFGHVGLTYLHKELKICPDITKSNELKISNPADRKNYCSFLSVPILAYKQNSSEEDCKGVLVLTSALPDQFSLERDRDFLLNLSSLIAIYSEVIYKMYVDTPEN